MHKKLTKTAAAMALVAFTATGCADMSATQRGTAQGAASAPPPAAAAAAAPPAAP